VRPWLVILLTVPALLVGGAVVATLIVLPPMVRDRVVAEAKARGVALEVDSVSLWFGSVGLESATFELEGVPGVHASAGRIDVLLDGMQPTRASIEDLKLDVARPLPSLIVDLEAWSRRHASAGGPGGKPIPFGARGVSVTWRSGPDTAPWLTLEGANVSQTATATVFAAPTATVAGANLSDVGASWTGTDARLALTLGSAQPEDATLTVSIDRTAQPMRAKVTLAPTPMPRLAGPLGVPVPMDDVLVRGQADLALPTDSGAALRGHADVTLDGFTPPHPVELGGFDFGKATTLSTDVALSPTYDRIDLTETLVRAGAFALRGGGKILRHDGYATAELTLRGNLPCGAIARSAARARAGSVLGKVLGNAAHRVLEGSVGVTVTIAADSRSPEAPQVTPRIGIGCGLKPLSLEEMADLGIDSAADLAKGLGVPGDLVDRARDVAARVPSALAEIPSGLPTLPSGLPVPRLPKLPIELEAKELDDSKPVAPEPKGDDSKAADPR
jgi:hypothetical protein